MTNSLSYGLLKIGNDVRMNVLIREFNLIYMTTK